MTDLLFALIIPLSGLAISVSAAVLYARIKKSGALIAAIGFGLTSLSWMLFPIAGSVLDRQDQFKDSLMVIYHVAYAVTLIGAITAAIGMAMLARQSKKGSSS